MNRSALSKAWNPLAIAGMAAALVLLAGLQYRWIGEMAEADRERLRRGAEASARQFRDDFNRELRSVGRAFDIGREALQRRDWDRFADRLEEYRASGSGLIEVEDLALLEVLPGGETQIWRLSADAAALEPADSLPPGLEPLLRRGTSRGGGFRGGPFGRFGAAFSSQVPALSMGLFAFDRPPEPGVGPRPEYVGALGVLLDADSFGDRLWPELSERYFGGAERVVYDVAILQGDELAYASRPGLDAESFAQAQVALPLVWRREEGPPQGRSRGRRGGPPGHERRGTSPMQALLETVAPVGPGPEWALVVQPVGGSVHAVVARLRRRNLVISLGILAVLGAGMAALLLSSRRAERLARLQMEFVAGVSHELRTPLAVIRSAGDNLAEGVVDAPEQVQDYGKLIRDEGRRLSGMVEQTLQFASSQAGRQVYKVESVPAGELLRKAIEDLEPAVQEAGFELEQQIERKLPAVLVDAAAASRILQSLVENALKYGGDSKRVSIEAVERGDAVAVTVRDQGVGIDPEDLPHIFEPFYRGRRALDAQIHGTGLGLSLASSAAEGFGGGLRAESQPGQGAAFTLTLPKAEQG